MAAVAMTPEIVANAIVAALSAGASTAAADTAKSAASDAYEGLKSLIKKRFGHDSDAAEAIDKLEDKPDSGVRKETLAEELKVANFACHPDLVSAAENLLRILNTHDGEGKHIPFVEGSRIAHADRGNTATAGINRAQTQERMVENLLQTASGTGNAQAIGEGATATAIINLGLQPEEIASLLHAAGAAQQTKINELAASLNTSSEAVFGFLATLKEDKVPIAQLRTKLALIAKRYVSMLERLGALDPEDNEALGYLGEAQKSLRCAATPREYDRADELLFKAEEAQDRSLRRVAALEREANEAACRLRHGKAATRAERGELSLTRLDYIKASYHFRFAADLVSANDLSLKLGYLTQSANALVSHGDEKGENASLLKAIDLYREALKETTREQMPLIWATLQNDLGNALGLLGERERGIEHLEEAVAAYREALKEQTQERVPLHWAATQTNLGNVLRVLGERERGIEHLEEAVAAYREALKEQTQERVPLQWAMTQSNLGKVLGVLGEREGGTRRLEEALAAIREAIKEQTRERVPLHWAMAQNNLGNVLRVLGGRERVTVRLEEAVSAYREALNEYTRERVPLQWAMTQSNLGNALVGLGERESGTARLEEAVAAYREALKEYTQERVPLQWAGMQNNLGNALGTLGEREIGNARLDEAVTAYRDALKERTRERVPLAWAATQNNLGNVFAALGKRESGTVRLEEAVAAYRDALTERTRERVPLQWSITQNNLENVHKILNDRESGLRSPKKIMQPFGKR